VQNATFSMHLMWIRKFVFTDLGLLKSNFELGCSWCRGAATFWCGSENYEDPALNLYFFCFFIKRYRYLYTIQYRFSTLDILKILICEIIPLGLALLSIHEKKNPDSPT
jgi:hypothetical protein